jgi:hypothetical protein
MPGAAVVQFIERYGQFIYVSFVMQKNAEHRTIAIPGMRLSPFPRKLVIRLAKGKKLQYAD